VLGDYQELARVPLGLKTVQKGIEIKKLPDGSTTICPEGNEPMHIVCLPVALPLTAHHGLANHNISEKDKWAAMGVYHPIMGLWAMTSTYCYMNNKGISGFNPTDLQFPEEKEQCYSKFRPGLLLSYMFDEDEEDQDFMEVMEQAVEDVQERNI
jgi:hypothetical protein